MRRTALALFTWTVLAAGGACGVAAAQTVEPPAAGEQGTPPSEPGAEAPGEGSEEATASAEVEPRFRPRGSTVFRLGQDHVVAADSVVRELNVIMGSAAVQGVVTRDAVVVLGTAHLSRGAVIEGSLVVIGGGVVIEPGARVGRDLVVVGGALEAPEGFSAGGEQIVIGPAVLGSRVAAVAPWITRGLLWGRVIVPDLTWVWIVVGAFFLVYLALNVLFEAPVRRTVVTLTEKPLTALVAGLLVLLLTVPVCLLLSVTLIGLAAVPVLLCALLIAGLFGKIAVARWIGDRVLPSGAEAADGTARLRPTMDFVVGFAAIGAAYMIPVLGLIAWTLVTVLGLGAATLAAMAAYRREHPPQVVPAREYLPAGPMPSMYVAEGLRHEAAPGGPLPSAAVPEGADLSAFPRAAFHERLAAFVLDIVLVLIAHAWLDLTDRDGAFFLFLLAYHIGFWTWKGTTVGGIICQLRLVRVDGSSLRFVDALVRGLSSIFSLAVAGLGALWILRDPERQAWHDRIAGTYVVKVPRNWPL